MIPKHIHFFWFSDDPYPENIQRCMESWKVILPGYEIKKWDLSNTPIEGAFAKRALKDKKWAFLSDYARLRVLHEYGGIYLDTDVLFVKPLDELLSNASFWGKDKNGLVEPVVIGALPNNKLVGNCLDRYINGSFSQQDFTPIPQIIAPVFKDNGFELHNETEEIEGNLILTFQAFCPMPFEQAEENPLAYVNENTFAVHLWNAAWFDPFRFFWNGRRKKGWKEIRKVLLSNPFQNKQFYRNVFYHLKCGIFGYPES